ncbi:hypothetical protein [Collinsella sp. AF38-3AC]|uniref:hypothetical protein n=1 Tax=Collinsella sp. AF38-3AC TaxID=2292015 RepID=UPI0013147351|nr:hypothetical protein [Collinsella sp. AF38-3AC]
MNTDMNPENINSNDSLDLNADTEGTHLMDTPDTSTSADVTAELPIAKDLEDATAPDSTEPATDDSQKPKNSSSLKRKFVAGGVALAIVAALGIGLSLNHEPVNIPDNAPVASAKAAEDEKTYPAAVTLEADGWYEGDGEFSYEIVDADGESAAKGDIVPGKKESVDLPHGAYALNVTSIPTAKDGKTTWLVPDAVDFVVEGKGASVKVSLTKVDMTDDAAVDAAIENLPEEERAAAKKLIEAKRENPNASAVSAPVSRPSNSTVQQAAASKPSGSNSNKNDSKPSTGSGSNSGSSSNKGDSKPSGSNKNDKEDKPASKPSGSGNSGSNSGSDSDSSKPSKPAEPEKVWAVITPAWDEQIYHPAVTHVEKQKVGVQYMADDGKMFDSEDDCAYYCVINGLQYSCLPKYQDVTVTDQAAWTETVHHEAVYGWVNK